MRTLVTIFIIIFLTGCAIYTMDDEWQLIYTAHTQLDSFDITCRYSKGDPNCLRFVGRIRKAGITEVINDSESGFAVGKKTITLTKGITLGDNVLLSNNYLLKPGTYIVVVELYKMYFYETSDNGKTAGALAMELKRKKL